MDPYILKCFKDYSYFLNIIRNLRNIKLNGVEQQYLYFFVYHPYSSPYDIEPDRIMLDDTGLRTNTNKYRRAKIVVNKLHKLNLLKRDTARKEKNPHKKNCYYLSEIGLFYIIRSSNFLHIDVQTLIKNYSHLKIFQTFLYPFIKLDTVCSPAIPINIQNISLYIQKQYLKIENFIFNNENRQDWNKDRWNWDIEKLRNHLIKKYSYKWLENADVEENYERMNITYFNNNNKLTDNIEVRLRGDKTSGYLINGTRKKKKEEITTDIKNFIIKLSLSKEECIGRAFSTLYNATPTGFIFFILSTFHSFNIDSLLIFSKDEKFLRSLETTKKDFNKIYQSIKNPYKYATEILITKNFLETFLPKEIQTINDKVNR